MFIEVKNLKKNYGDVAAVKGIDFAVEKGSLFSFLGTNGAGKSTTISILTTLIKPTSGTAKVAGFDVVKDAERVRTLIGIVFQESILDKDLTVQENLEVRGSLYGYKGEQLNAAVKRVIELTQLEEIAKRRYKTLSGGQKRRTDIARALIHTPEILFLDEPTTGLDPKTRQDVWQLITDLQQTHGMTIFLTTHYMEEAANSDQIVIIHKGEIKAVGTPESLKEKYSTDTLKLTLNTGERQIIPIKKTTDAFAHIDPIKDTIDHIEIISGTLDDVFLTLRGE